MSSEETHHSALGTWRPPARETRREPPDRSLARSRSLEANPLRGPILSFFNLIFLAAVSSTRELQFKCKTCLALEAGELARDELQTGVACKLAVSAT